MRTRDVLGIRTGGIRTGGIRVADFLSDRGGNFATFSALVAPLLICLGAVAIDSASLYYERRESQALADLAAITAAANIDQAEASALAVLKDNGIEQVVLTRGGGGSRKDVDTSGPGRPVALTVQPGRYQGKAGTAVLERFVVGARPYNAVKVTLKKTGTQYFAAPITGAPSISTAAVASAPAEAAFSIGSRLLRIDGGLLNALLSGLTGSQFSLTVMDYESLAKADIDAFRFSEALNTKLKLNGTTYTEVLQSQASVGDIATVIADLGGIDRNAMLAAQAFSRSSGKAGKVDLEKLFSLGSAAGLPIGHAPAGLTAKVSALDMLTAAAALANGTHQVELDLGAKIPGLLSATVELAIGEPPQSSPWFTVGQSGSLVRTAQTRLKVVAEVGGPGGLIGASVKIPLYVELAFAEAELVDITCTGTKKVTVAARPGIAALRITEVDALDDFSRDPAFATAVLVKAPLVTVSGSAHVEAANKTATNLVFTETDIEKRTIKTVETKNITSSLTRSLLDDLNLSVKVAGGTLVLPGTLSKSVKDVLATATPAIDQLLDGLLATLGVHLGEADVRVTGLSCGRSVLVQ